MWWNVLKITTERGGLPNRFRDKLNPTAAEYILSFTANAHIVDTLPINENTRKSMRDFGVESDPAPLR